MMHLAENLVLFVRTLRAQGVAVRAGGTLDAVRALEHVGTPAQGGRARCAADGARQRPR